MERKRVEFLGITRNIPGPRVSDGALQEMINLRPMDGAWRPAGPKSYEIETLPKVRWIHRINASTYAVICQKLVISGAPTIRYYTVSNGVKSDVSDTDCPCTDDTQFANWHNALVVSDPESETTSILILNEVTLLYSVFNGIDGVSQLPELPHVTFSRLAVPGDNDTDEFDISAEMDIGDALLAEYVKCLHDKADMGYLCGNLLFRCAWEMSDGTIVKQSMPEKMIVSVIQTTGPITGTITTVFTAYKLQFKINCPSEWLSDVKTKYKNIIKGLNIYVTIPRASESGEGRYVPIKDGVVYAPRNASYETDILSAYIPDVESELYFLLKHVALNNLVADTVTTLELESLNDMSTRSSMPINNFSHHTIYGKSLFSYNDRIFMGNIKNYLFKSGFITGLISPGASNTSGSTYAIGIEFDIAVSSRKTLTVFSGWTNFNYYNSADNQIEFWIKYNEFTQGSVPGHRTTTTIEKGYWGYPDSRAQLARIFITNDGGTTVRLCATCPLTSVSAQNFSYCQGLKVKGVLSSFSTSELADSLTYYYDNNRIQVCDIGNPFFSPPINSYRVTGDVIGMSTNAIALSQGQFGQFPMFAFTSEGIWAMTIGDGDTLISSIVPLSREVCNNSGSITGIDGGTVFSTGKGLFVVSGSQVIEIGKPAEGLYLSPLSGLAVFQSIMNNANLYQASGYICSASFLSYISGAKIGWDYKHSEIVVSNSSYNYSWVYSVENKSWHKISEVFDRFIVDYPVTYGFRQVLNSENKTEQHKADLTTETFSSLVTVHMETRPMKFTESVYKKILRLLMNAEIYENGEYPFSMNLFGSTDGVHWVQLNSSATFGAQTPILVGRANFSCKYFILVAGGKVDQYAYFNGFDVDLESRYSDKLR